MLRKQQSDWLDVGIEHFNQSINLPVKIKIALFGYIHS